MSPKATHLQALESSMDRLLHYKRLWRNAGRNAEEVITHLVGQFGASVKVTLEIEAEIPDGAPDNVVRIVTENGRTLKFTSGGFEKV